MKCLQVSGEESLTGRFIAGMLKALEGTPVLVASRNTNGDVILTCSGSQDIASVLRSIPPALMIMKGFQELAAPVVWCGGEPPEGLRPIVLDRYHGDDDSIDWRGILDRTFHLLPQKTGEECGRCGMDCRGLAEAIIGGTGKPGDCWYSRERIRIEQDGAPMEIGEFPAGMVETTIRGMLSSLKGYREGSEIAVRLNCPPQVPGGSD